MNITKNIEGICFVSKLQDDSIFATRFGTENICILDADTFAVKQEIDLADVDAERGNTFVAEFSDGRLAVSALNSKDTYILNKNNLEIETILPYGPVNAIAVNLENNLVVFGNVGEYKVYDGNSYEELHYFKLPCYSMSFKFMFPDGKFLVELNHSHEYLLVDTQKNQTTKLLGFKNQMITSVIRKDGVFIALGEMGGEIYIFDATYTLIKLLRHNGSSCSSEIGFLPNGDLLLTSSDKSKRIEHLSMPIHPTTFLLYDGKTWDLKSSLYREIDLCQFVPLKNGDMAGGNYGGNATSIISFN